MKKNWKQSVALLMMSLIICIGIVAVPKAVFADTDDIYWVLDNNNKLWISNSELADVQESKKSGTGMWPHGGNTGNYDYDMEYVTEVEFVNKVVIPNNAWGLFKDFKKCKSIKNIRNMDISQLTSLSYAFYECAELTSLDIGHWDTSKITGMGMMFSGCKSLKTLDVSNFNTSNVKDMGCMFSGCQSLSVIDVSKFDTSNVVGMTSMFANCRSLNKLEVGKFDTSKVGGMASMFFNCKQLTQIDVSRFTTSKVTSINSMFENCESLTSLNVKNFNTEEVVWMYQMFTGCKSLKQLDVSGFKTPKARSMWGMFDGCESLQSLKVDNFDTSYIDDLNFMFRNCKSLKTLDLKNFKTANVKNMQYVFEGCESLTSIDVSGFDTQNATSMNNMFKNCRSLVTLDVSGFDISKVQSLSFMFSGCTSLKTLDLSSFIISDDTSRYNMLYFDTSEKEGAIEELTVSDSLNKGLEGACPFGNNKYGRTWFVKNPEEVNGEYDVNGYDRTQASEMEGLALTGNKITYIVGERTNTSPVITASDKTVDFGTSLAAAIKDFTATDKEDGVLPLKVKDNGGYNPQKAGAYNVKLSATDSKGAEKTKTIKITVKENPVNSESAVDKRIKTGGEEPKGATFRLLQAKSTKVTNNSVTLTWNKVPKAAKYVVYGNKCGAKNKYIKLTTTKKQKITYKKIHKANVKKGTYYKFVVVAFDKNNKAISTSKTVHVATKGGKVGNDKKVTTAAKKNKVSLKKGKTFKLKAKPVVQSKKLKVKRHRKMAYETSNSKVAIVTGGKIKAIGKGSCYIYAYTQNGVCAKVKVIVK